MSRYKKRNSAACFAAKSRLFLAGRVKNTVMTTLQTRLNALTTPLDG